MAAAGVFTGVPSAAAESEQPGNKHSGTRVVLLGVGGGPSILPGAECEGIASALVVGDRYYLIDAGHGVLQRIRQAQLGTWQSPSDGPLDQMRALFITHLHSDHVADLASIFTSGIFNGLQRADLPVKLIGPGRRGALPPLYGPAPAPPVVSPQNPTPGIKDMWDLLVQMYATDFNDRARDNRTLVPSQMVEARDVELPAWATADPNGSPHPAMDPVQVYEDDRVKVTATLVQHAPIFPALAYRFDTEAGSVVFSGDTGPSDNLVRLARNTDVLVHEVISEEWVNAVIPEPRTPAQEAALQHLLGAHTKISEVGPLAERAGAKMLVLNHLVPQTLPSNKWKAARHGYSGKLVVGKDLMQIAVSSTR